MEVWSLVGKITLDGFKGVETQLNSLEGKLKANEKAFNALKNAGMALVGVTAAIAGGSLKAAIDFETAFAGVRKTVDATEEEFADLETGIRDMSKELPKSANEIAGVAEAAGQLGIATGDILDFTEVMVKLGMATNLSADEAATSLARFANITGMSSDEYENMGATIVALGNNFATTESEIVDMAMRIAGAGTAAGMSEKEILALSASLSSLGLRAEMGGTAISQTLLTMNSAIIAGGEDMALFAEIAGVSAEEFKVAYKENATDALLMFMNGLGELNNTGADTSTMLDTLGLGGIRVEDMLLRTSNAQALVTSAVNTANTAWTENAALNEEVEKRNETAAAKMDILKNRVADVAINIGDALIPVITSLIDKLAPIIDKVSNWIRENEGLTKTILAIAGAGGALLLFVGLIPKIVGMFTGFIQAIKLIASATKIVTAAQWLWNVAMTANPIGLIIVAIAALIAAIVLIVKNWDWVKEKIAIVWEGIKSIFENAWNGIKNFFGNIGEFFSSIPEAIGKAFSTIKDIILSPFRAAWKGIESGINWLIGMLNKISFDIPDWVPLIGGKHFGISIPPVSLPSFEGWEGRVPGMEGEPYLAVVHGGEYISQSPQGGVNLNVTIPGMVIREEADINKLSKAFERVVVRELRTQGVTNG
jgi:TP901 family phage tail tape measure protein